MKSRIIPALIVPLISSGLYGLINLGEGTVDFNLQLSSYYDTEIRARGLGQEDFIFSFRPSLVYRRPSRNLDLSASVGIDSRTYLDFDQYDDTDVFFDLNISPNADFQTSRFRFSGDVILNTETLSDDAVGEIITVNNYGASGQLVYDPNRHYSVIGALAYRQRDPDSEFSSYYATETTDVSLSVEIPRSEMINWSAGIRYRDTASDGPTTNSETITYFLGLNGNLLPKVNGSLSAGLQDRSFEVLEDTTSPYISASLSWIVDDLSNISLTASQGMGTTLDDRASENLSIRLTGTREFSRSMNGSLFVGYDRDEYDSQIAALVRDDKESYIGAALNYKIVRWGSIGLDIRYSDQTSSNSQFDYDRLRAGVRFSATW